LGIDPGRTNIGLDAVREDGENLYSAKCETCNKNIPKQMADRKRCRQASRRGERKRRQRRVKKIGTTFADGTASFQLCEEHHGFAHKEKPWADELVKRKADQNKKYGALSVLNQIIPKLVSNLEGKYHNKLFVTDGRSTWQFWQDHGMTRTIIWAPTALLVPLLMT